MSDEQANLYQGIRLRVGENVEHILMQRLITREVLQEVIYHAEISGKKIINDLSRHFLAYYRPKSVFYWVEYSAADNGYDIHAAYTHRMVMKSSATSKEWVNTGRSVDWRCNQCHVPLEIQTVRLQYMQSIFPIDLPACSSCGFILVEEELATGKIAEAEQALEDK